MKYIDLFSGCGGLSLGLLNSGWCGQFAVEKSSDAFLTLKHNLIDQGHYQWPEWLPISNIDINNLLANFQKELKLKENIDLVAGGPPCQGFSSAGKRVESDIRNKLVESYIKTISILKPKILFFENVTGFTKPFSSQKNFSEYIEDELNAQNYHTKWQLVNFSDFGIPQSRTRFILVGFRNDIFDSSTPDEFFKKLYGNRKSFCSERNISYYTTVSEAISDLYQRHGTIPSRDSNGFKNGIYGEVSSKYQTYMRKMIISDYVDSHRFVNHSDKIVQRFKEAIHDQLSPAEYKKTYSLKKTGTRLLQRDEPTPTLTTLPDDYIHYSEPRILTVREYARIQSFPDHYEFKGRYTTGSSQRKVDVPRYTQIGNAIPPLFSEQVGIILKGFLNGRS